MITNFASDRYEDCDWLCFILTSHGMNQPSGILGKDRWYVNFAGKMFKTQDRVLPLFSFFGALRILGS